MTRRILATIVASLAALVSASQPAYADHMQTRLSVEAHSSVKLEQGYVLGVHLETSDGRGVGDATVRFYDVVELFGRREMLIGGTTTDGQGRASISYLPAQTGQHQILVRFPGREHLAPVAAEFPLLAAVAAPTYRSEPSGLALFSTRVPYVVGAVVLVVWGLIAFAFIATARGVIASARREKKGDTA